MVHRRSIEDREVAFGNQGALFGNAMTWFDYDTGSVWSQPLGEAILGPAKGAKLELLPSTLTRWGEWLRLFPDSLALDAPGQNAGYDLDELSIVVAFANDSAAYPYRNISAVINDTVGGVPIAVVVEPDSRDSWSVWSRNIERRSHRGPVDRSDRRTPRLDIGNDLSDIEGNGDRRSVQRSSP